MIDTRFRTQEAEIMDDFLMEGAELEKALGKIATINQVLGGNSITITCVKRLLKNIDPKKTIRIADMGCGNGDMLRKLALLGRGKKLNFQLIGIDANAHTIRHATALSQGFDEISYKCADFLEEHDEQNNYDIILTTLTLHHFSNEEIVKLLKQFKQQAKIGIVINDLHRSKVAYYLFKAISKVFRLDNMTKSDGLTSILRGFKKAELKAISERLNLKRSTIAWKWAYRYQWVIKTL